MIAMYYTLCLSVSALCAANGIFIKQYQRGAANIKNADHIFNFIISVFAALFYALTGVFSGGIALNADFIPYL